MACCFGWWGIAARALAKSYPGPHPPQPTPLSRHGLAALRVGAQAETAGLVSLLRVRRLPAFSFSRVTPYSGAGAIQVRTGRGEPFRQSLLAVCGGRLTLVRAERSSANPNLDSPLAAAARCSYRARRPHSGLGGFPPRQATQIPVHRRANSSWAQVATPGMLSPGSPLERAGRALAGIPNRTSASSWRASGLKAHQPHAGIGA